MKLFGRRKATNVRKRKQARRERRTILLFVSLISRRIIAGRVLGEVACSLSRYVPIMPLCGSMVVLARLARLGKKWKWKESGTKK